MTRALHGSGFAANSRRVLVVDGYEQVRDLLLKVFTLEQFEVDATADADVARCRLSQGLYDLALLDLDLQEGKGHRLCNWAVTSTAVPVIAMSAYADELAVVTALDSGVSDFVRKPFRKRELVARARAQLRWQGWHAAGDAEIIELDHVRVEIGSRRALVGGEQVHLPAKEFDVLVELMRHAGRTVTRRDLLDRVWGEGYRTDAKTLDVHVRRVRDKIENAGARLIHTVRGLGFRYDPLQRDADALVVD